MKATRIVLIAMAVALATGNVSAFGDDLRVQPGGLYRLSHDPSDPGATRNWIAFDGDRLLTEPEFYRAVGSPEMFRESMSYHDGTRAIRLLSFLSAGGAGVAAGLSGSDGVDRSLTIGISIGGVIVSLVSHAVWMQRVRRQFSTIRDARSFLESPQSDSDTSEDPDEAQSDTKSLKQSIEEALNDG